MKCRVQGVEGSRGQGDEMQGSGIQGSEVAKLRNSGSFGN